MQMRLSRYRDIVIPVGEMRNIVRHTVKVTTILHKNMGSNLKAVIRLQAAGHDTDIAIVRNRFPKQVTPAFTAESAPGQIAAIPTQG